MLVGRRFRLKLTDGQADACAEFASISRAVWNCGHRANADENAAKNILKAAGLAVSACGDLDISRSAKQEPVPPQGDVHQPGTLVGIPRP